MMLRCWIPAFVVSVYAWMSPHTPNRVPPKYLVTTTKISKSSAPVITDKIGFHAVFAGSPSSEDLWSVVDRFRDQKRSC